MLGIEICQRWAHFIVPTYTCLSSILSCMVIKVDHTKVPKAKGPMRPKYLEVGLHLGPRLKKLQS